MIIGYARVSTLDQNLELQRDALEKAGCEQVFEDHVSGARMERPGWEKAQAVLRKGDTFVVWRLDRLGRSLKHLIDTVNELDARGIGFKSLNESIDTTTPGGRLVFPMFGALAEFERELIRERTHAGLAAARTRGRKGGRPRKLAPRRVATARTFLGDGKYSVTEVAEMLGCRATRSTGRSVSPWWGGAGVRMWYRRRKDPRTGEVYYEHRAMAEWKLGQRLRPGEVVHHKNGDRSDNHPDNLEVLPS
jgi:DNA invertase Pin-like site-specific DNA recombinase